MNSTEILEFCKRKKIKAVIFDLYGTLVFKEVDLNPYRMLLSRLNDFGIPVKDLPKTIMTKPLNLIDIANQFGGLLSEDEIGYYENILEQELLGIRLHEGAENLIKALEKMGVKVAICSNLALPYEKPAKQLLPFVNNWICSFRVGMKKPDPEIYHLCLKTLGCQASQTLMVGDSLANDVRGPKIIGINAIMVNH